MDQNGQAAQIKDRTAKGESTRLDIDQIKRETLLVPLKGLTELIIHNWDDKAKRKMLQAQQGVKAPKMKRDPSAEYQAAFYLLSDKGYGFPAGAFKQATIGGARYYGSDVKMTEL